MDRSDFKELYYIVPIANVPSIMEQGILSHRLAQKHNPVSVADPEVQERRSDKPLPNNLTLHRCANLYFNPRNAMMYRRKDSHMELAILRVNRDVMSIEGVLVSDMNAARDAVRFGTPDEMLPRLNRDDIYRMSWDVADQNEKYRLKGTVCAEILVPNRIDPCYIIGAFVSCEVSRVKFANSVPGLNADVKPALFFR